MTDFIDIPFLCFQTAPTTPCGIRITPEIARRIVALSGEREYQQGGINTIMERIEALEAWQKAYAKEHYPKQAEQPAAKRLSFEGCEFDAPAPPEGWFEWMHHTAAVGIVSGVRISILAKPAEQPAAREDEAAEYRRLCAACWKQLGVSTYDGKSIPEHIASLRDEVEILQQANAAWESRCLAAEAARDAARAELEQAKRERDIERNRVDVGACTIRDLKAERDAARDELERERKRTVDALGHLHPAQNDKEWGAHLSQVAAWRLEATRAELAEAVSLLREARVELDDLGQGNIEQRIDAFLTKQVKP